MQENHSNYSRVAQYALVLDNVKPDPVVPTNLPNLLTAFQPDSSQEITQKSKSSSLAPRASLGYQRARLL